MRITIKTTNLELTYSFHNYLKRKIQELEKFVTFSPKKSSYHFLKKRKSDIEAFVEIGRTTYHHRKGPIFRAEIQIKFPRQSLRAEAERENLYLAINEAKEELEREIKRWKGKRISLRKRRLRKLKKDLNLSFLARFSKKREGS